MVLLFGFSSGESNWSSTETIACLTIGCVVLCAAIVVELKTKRSPIIPPRLFKIRTSAAVLIGTFMQSFGFMALSYYVRFRMLVIVSKNILTQSRSIATTVLPSIRIKPSHVGSQAHAILGRIVSRFYRSRILRRKSKFDSLFSVLSQTRLNLLATLQTRKYKPIMLVSYLIMALGFALLATLDDKSNTHVSFSFFPDRTRLTQLCSICSAQQVLYLLVAALGCGPLFQAPYIAIQSAMPMADMPTATATVSLIRQIGGTVGIAVAGAMYGSKLKSGLSSLGYEPPAGSGSSVGNVNGLQSIQVRLLPSPLLLSRLKLIDLVCLASRTLAKSSTCLYPCTLRSMDSLCTAHLRWILGELRIETVLARSNCREKSGGRQREKGEEGG